LLKQMMLPLPPSHRSSSKKHLPWLKKMCSPLLLWRQQRQQV
jgi:hypothetical protein